MSTARRYGARLRSRLVRPPAFGRLGEGSVLADPLHLDGTRRIRIGPATTFATGAWISAGPDGAIRIGRETRLGRGLHLHAVDLLRIGHRCLIGDDVIVTTVHHRRSRAPGATTSERVRIGDDVRIGDGAVVLGGVRIGDGATIGAGAVVTRDVAPRAAVTARR